VKSKKTFYIIIERLDNGTLVATVPQVPGLKVEAPMIADLRKRVRAEIERKMAEKADSVAIGYAGRFVGVETMVI
jgi:hypothetical protein